MRLAHVLPGVAIGFVAVVILGPGNARPVLGARVYATPTESTRKEVRSARVVAVWRLGEAETPATDVPLDLRWGPEAHAAHARTGPDGVADVAFLAPAAPGEGIVVESGGRQVAFGIFAGGGPESDVAPVASEGREEGELHVILGPVRGQLAPPFQETISVRVVGPDDAPTGAHVVVDLVGASPAKVELDIEPWFSVATFDVHPEAMRVDVEAHARDAKGREGAFVGSMTTVPGALWVDPKSPPGGLRIVAPAPRKAAYVSFLDDEGRFAGAVVPLHEDDDGFHRGTVAIPEHRSDQRLDVVVAGDPEETGPATVLWPLEPSARFGGAMRGTWSSTPGTIALPRLVRVADGVPAAVEADHTRVGRVRTMAVAVALVVGLVEILLLIREGRRAQERLDAHFAAQAEAAEGVEDRAAIRHVAESAAKSGSLTATALGVLVAIAFGIVAAFVVAR